MMGNTMLPGIRKNNHPIWRELVVDFTAYAYILLYFYTAFSKLITYSSFLKVLSDLPVIGDWHELVAIALILIEIVFGLLLVFPKTRLLGLWLSLGLMMTFTFYLSYHIMVNSKLLCSCGGVISGMSWPQHVVFNAGFIFAGAVALIINKDYTIKIFSRGSR